MNDQTDNQEPESAKDDWAAAMAEQAAAEGGAGETGVEAEAGDTATAAGQTLEAGSQPAPMEVLSSDQIPAGNEDANLELILDIPVTIAMEIGRTRISIRNLLQLNQGSVVELDRLAGEPMDVLVNGTLVAHGEVVVVNEKFGIRLTDVISPAERVQKLR